MSKHISPETARLGGAQLRAAMTVGKITSRQIAEKLGRKWTCVKTEIARGCKNSAPLRAEIEMLLDQPFWTSPAQWQATKSRRAQWQAATGKFPEAVRRAVEAEHIAQNLGLTLKSDPSPRRAVLPQLIALIDNYISTTNPTHEKIHSGN